MNNKAIVWVVVLIAVVLVGGFFLFRDGTGGVAGTEGVMMDDGEIMEGETTMEVSAPGHENIDEMMEEGDSMMEEDDMMTDDGAMMESAIEVIATASGWSSSSITIVKGDTVIFVNKSDRDIWPASALHPTHTVYDGTSLSEHCPNPSGSALDACGGVAPGASWAFTFTKTGEWAYHDHLNPRNFGKVIVE